MPNPVTVTGVVAAPVLPTFNVTISYSDGTSVTAPCVAADQASAILLAQQVGLILAGKS